MFSAPQFINKLLAVGPLRDGDQVATGSELAELEPALGVSQGGKAVRSGKIYSYQGFGSAIPSDYYSGDPLPFTEDSCTCQTEKNQI